MYVMFYWYINLHRKIKQCKVNEITANIHIFLVDIKKEENTEESDDDNVLNGHSGILYYIQPRKKRTHLLYDLTSMLHCFN